MPNDYVVVKVALRGSDKSKGVLSPWSKAEDYYEVIEWAESVRIMETSGQMVFLILRDSMVGRIIKSTTFKSNDSLEGLNDMYRSSLSRRYTGYWLLSFLDSRYFARWTDNPNIEDLIQAQQEHPLFDDFWKQRQVPLSQIKTPLLCASWSTQGLQPWLF